MIKKIAKNILQKDTARLSAVTLRLLAYSPTSMRLVLRQAADLGQWSRFGALGECIVESLHLSEGLAYTSACPVRTLRRLPVVPEALADRALAPTGARRRVAALHKVPPHARAGVVAACPGEPTGPIEKRVLDPLCGMQEEESARGERAEAGAGAAGRPVPLLGDGRVATRGP